MRVAQRRRSARALQSTQTSAHGSASSRSSGRRRPAYVHTPYVPFLHPHERVVDVVDDLARRCRQQEIALPLDVDGVALARLLVELRVATLALARELLGLGRELLGLAQRAARAPRGAAGAAARGSWATGSARSASPRSRRARRSRCVLPPRFAGAAFAGRGLRGRGFAAVFAGAALALGLAVFAAVLAARFFAVDVPAGFVAVVRVRAVDARRLGARRPALAAVLFAAASPSSSWPSRPASSPSSTFVTFVVPFAGFFEAFAGRRAPALPAGGMVVPSRMRVRMRVSERGLGCGRRGARLNGAERAGKDTTRLGALQRAGARAIARGVEKVVRYSRRVPFRAVDRELDLVALEARVLQRWADDDVFAESLRRREGAPEWVFYEGPPTANGRPGLHHVWARSFKDLFPRFHTMRGRYVARKGGWDCHGLPVELEVEKELGFSGKQRDRGVRHRRVQPAVPRVGAPLRRGLVGAHGPHRDVDRHRRRVLDARQRATSRASGGTSSRCGTRGLLYEGFKVVPVLRSVRHRPLESRGRAGLRGRHRAVRVRALPARRRRLRPARVDDDAVDARRPTSRPRSGPTCATSASRDATVRATSSLAADRVDAVLGDDATIVGEVAVADLVGRRYERPFDMLPIADGRDAVSSSTTSSRPTRARASCTWRRRSARSTARSASARALPC